MFGTALEVVIGLIFVYLMLSLVVSALNELFAHFLRLRAKTLELGMERLLRDDHLKNIKDAIYDHPVMQGMTSRADHKPSYIPGSLFSLALIDTIVEKTKAELDKPEPYAAATEVAAAGGAVAVALAPVPDPPPTPDAGDAPIEDVTGLPPLVAVPPPAAPAEAAAPPPPVVVPTEAPPVAVTAAHDEAQRKRAQVNNLRRAIRQLPRNSRLRRALEALVDESVSDMRQARARIEGWFDDSMSRVSGWYKRKMQLWILGIGAFVAFAGNVDSIRVAEALAHDSALRASLGAAAERVVKERPAGTTEGTTATAAVVVDVANQFQMSKLPVGWPEVPLHPMRNVWLYLLYKLCGLLLTTLAVTQGAPFWFDMLNRVVNIRSAGKPPAIGGSGGAGGGGEVAAAQ